MNFENGVTNTFDQDFRVNYGAVNVTGNAGSKVLYRVGANFSPYETKRTLPSQTGQTTLTDPDNYLRGTKGDRHDLLGLDRLHPVVAAGVLGPRRPVPDRRARARA